jgi:chemotaxis protein methyltransferase CheR
MSDCKSGMPSVESRDAPVFPNTGMSDRDFERMCVLILGRSGIRITAGKKILLEGRIARRMKIIEIADYGDYCDYLFSAKGMANELIPMIDSISTNKTEFFREPWHFEFLRNTALPFLKKLYGAGISRKLLVWSSACSSGEEPFTLAMVLEDVRSEDSRFQFEILATDISTKVLAHAQAATYNVDRVDPIPNEARRKYLLKSRDMRASLVKIVPELRNKVVFKRFNLMNENYLPPGSVDIIFCRNVIIYFDRETQQKVIRRLCQCLVPGGYLFMGHSETLTNMCREVQPVGTSVYQKPWDEKRENN